MFLYYCHRAVWYAARQHDYGKRTSQWGHDAPTRADGGSAGAPGHARHAWCPGLWPSASCSRDAADVPGRTTRTTRSTCRWQASTGLAAVQVQCSCAGVLLAQQHPCVHQREQPAELNAVGGDQGSVYPHNALLAAHMSSTYWVISDRQHLVHMCCRAACPGPHHQQQAWVGLVQVDLGLQAALGGHHGLCPWGHHQVVCLEVSLKLAVTAAGMAAVCRLAAQVCLQ